MVRPVVFFIQVEEETGPVSESGSKPLPLGSQV